jgi:hypothetical protein
MAQQRLRDGFAQLVQSARRFSLSRDSFFWLWRSGAMGRPATQEGFILPTVTLLLLILSLVVGLLIFRTFSRTEQISGARKQKVIYNYATPAIDRAKAKIEYLFTEDSLPLPPSDQILKGALGKAAYTFPGETRLDLNGDGVADNAWKYDVDVDGNNQPETVVYSLLSGANTNAVTTGNVTTPGLSIASAVNFNKARKGVTRNGPINLLGGAANAQCQSITTIPEAGWESVSGSLLRKALQVNAVVIGKNKGGQVPIATLEMQQDREVDKGNKWGAWFRTDLELSPGSDFRWNGAMHSEGSMFMQGGATLRMFLISSSSSCVYSKDASTITVSSRKENYKASATSTAVPYNFDGHIVVGTVRDNGYADGNFAADPYVPTGSPSSFSLTKSSDSIKQDSTNPADKTSAIALDPIVLFTEDRNSNISGSGAGSVANTFGTNHLLDDTVWGTQDISNPDKSNHRFERRQVKAPFLDDTFRADNRFGPKPKYNATPAGSLQTLGVKLGTTIDPATALPAENQKLIEESPRTADPYDEVNYGYDGYWERRAKDQGVRVIVGQRLELGNRFGWNNNTTAVAGANNDPESLYPPTSGACAGTTGKFGNSAALTDTASRCHEQKQMRTLRDNLAAVQGMAIYHYKGTTSTVAGAFPVACMATTAHPGTATTISNSTTFGSVTVAGNARVRTDFLGGNGTNGWEFAPPGGDEAGFKTALSGDLGKSLRNLAYFAGDPEGGMPSYAAPASPSRVYPDPTQTMWGDFSMLRRLMDNNANLATSYDNLSIADKSVLHSAACTVQMLGYNVQNVAEGDKLGPLKANGAADLKSLEDAITVVTAPGSAVLPDSASMQDAIYNEVKRSDGEDVANRVRDAVAKTADFIQVQRDRRYGFKKLSTASLSASSTYTLSKGKITFNTYAGGAWNQQKNVPKGRKIAIGFDYAEGGYLGLGEPSGTQEEVRFVKIASALGGSSTGLSPRYPSLYYIFPLQNHTVAGAAAQGDDQPVGEDYIVNAAALTLLQNGYTFQSVSLATGSNAVGASRKSDQSDWLTPTTTTLTYDDPGSGYSTTSARTGIARNVVKYKPDPASTTGELNFAVGFLDRVFYNGREALANRVMDIDLDLLRSSFLGKTSTAATDSWLPLPNFVPSGQQGQTLTGSVFYSFREDAVREDSIQRPVNAAASDLKRMAQYFTGGVFDGNYLMRAVGATPQDPPRSTLLGISPKAVDFFADPDRRPNGFRLRNGADIRRRNGLSATTYTTDNMRGLSFVSDNPVYVQGNFNRHSGEEFTTALSGNWNNFYTRNNLNFNFACEAGSSTDCTTGDSWRPVEVIADMISLLSNNFIDGNTAQGMFTDRGTLTDATRTSFMTMPAPGNSNKPSAVTWQLEDGTTTFKYVDATTPLPTLPIKMSRDNYFLQSKTAPTAPVEVGKTSASDKDESNADIYFVQLRSDPSRRNWINAALETTYNMTFVSGITPSRQDNYNGGLHNFPRQLENWNNRNLYFSGAMVQLNFSTSATAPYDLEAWEPGLPAINGNEDISYYGVPVRSWGYDVGLQYAPAGAVARRFVSAGNVRSEFYRDLPIDDPYVRLLRCAKIPGSNARMDLGATNAECTP